MESKTDIKRFPLEVGKMDAQNKGRAQMYLLVPGIKAVHKLAFQFRIHNSLFPPLKLIITDNKLIDYHHEKKVISSLFFSFVFVIFFPWAFFFSKKRKTF